MIKLLYLNLIKAVIRSFCGQIFPGRGEMYNRLICTDLKVQNA